MYPANKFNAGIANIAKLLLVLSLLLVLVV